MNTSRTPSLFFFAGELSGDMYGAQLIRALRKLLGNFEVSGVAGPEMRRQGVVGNLTMENFSVMGFTDVLRVLPRLWKQFHQIRKQILEEKPDAIIFIDSPSFSLRMAKALRKAGFTGKIIQYICPTVWAWGKNRVYEMAETFDLLLTIYPFELQYFADTSLRVEYVGHPLQERIKSHHYATHWQKLFGIKNTEHLVGLFPGSRPAEISRNLPKQLEAAKMLQKSYPEAKFAISCAHEQNMLLVQEILQKQNVIHNRDVFFVPKVYSYELMRTCRSAIAKSGTVTLELALHRCPTVVSYELTALNRFIAKYILKVKLPHYCIVNILLGKSVYPELIERSFTPNDLFDLLKPLHAHGKERDTCVADCSSVQELLKEQDASERAAKAIQQIL